MNKNLKVPFSILCCFLILFILQGSLKLLGIFTFEKTLDWKIFEIIDNSIALSIIYYSFINMITVYCLSFSLSDRAYSNKWYHYVLIAIGSIVMTILKFFVIVPVQVSFVYDAISYIIIPTIINLTTDTSHKPYEKNNFVNTVITISIHILLYFCYLGINYWNARLNSLIPSIQTVLYASTSLLLYFETHIAIALLMLSLNISIMTMKNKRN